MIRLASNRFITGCTWLEGLVSHQIQQNCRSYLFINLDLDLFVKKRLKYTADCELRKGSLCENMGTLQFEEGYILITKTVQCLCCPLRNINCFKQYSS